MRLTIKEWRNLDNYMKIYRLNINISQPMFEQLFMKSPRRLTAKTESKKPDEFI